MDRVLKRARVLCVFFIGCARVKELTWGTGSAGTYRTLIEYGLIHDARPFPHVDLFTTRTLCDYRSPL